jgi:hypothetical protein
MKIKFQFQSSTTSSSIIISGEINELKKNKKNFFNINNTKPTE